MPRVDERRRFFRIDDEVALSAVPIEDADSDARINDFWDNEHAFSIRNNFNYQIERHISDRNKIAMKMPELARYLGVLEAQIDRLTERLAGDDGEPDLASKSVNLSAQGIAYHDDSAPAPGSMVELTLKLVPSGLMLVVIARVIKLNEGLKDSEGSNRISLDFEQIHDADREILIKYIHSKQMKSLSSENSPD